jgi:hypothetical protein
MACTVFYASIALHLQLPKCQESGCATPTPPAITLGEQTLFELLYMLQVVFIITKIYSQALSSGSIFLSRLARPAAAAAAVLAKAQKSVLCCSQGVSAFRMILCCTASTRLA